MVWGTFSQSVVAFLAVALISQTQGFNVQITNRCDKSIDLFDAKTVESISPGGSITRTIAPDTGAHVYRSGTGAQATLAEFSGDGGRAWFDISIIPTGPKSGPDYCESLQACKDYTGGVGFNVAMQISPKTPDGDRCRVLTCMADGCPDAYQYPKDDIKTHTCVLSTDFEVTFCPGGSGGATPAPTPPPTTQAPTPPPTTQTPAPTPSPTPSPTPTPTPTPSPKAELESGVLEAGVLESSAAGSSSSSSSHLRSEVGDEQDRSIEDSDETLETITPTVHTEDTTSEIATAGEATPASDSTVAIGDSSSSVQEVNAKSTGAEGANTGIYFIAIVGAVAMVAGTAIVAVRRKKAQLDALDDKTPVAGADHNRRMMTTPAGSCIL